MLRPPRLAVVALLALVLSPPRPAAAQERTPAARAAGAGAATDTAATKAALMVADGDLAWRAAAKGAAVVLDALAPDAAVLFPGQPILRGPRAARVPFLARYGGSAVYHWRALHAVASTDGRFGCTVGYSHFVDTSTTVVQAASSESAAEARADSNRAGRRGTYVACWRRADARAPWRLVALQRNDSPGRPPRQLDDSAICRLPHSATVALGGDVHAQITANERAFARAAAEPAGPGPAFARWIASDGLLFSGDLPQGPARVAAVFADYPADQVLAWGPMPGFGGGSGGLAYTVGHAVNGPRAGKAGPAHRSKFLTVWRQEADGSWRFLFDLGSDRR